MATFWDGFSLAMDRNSSNIDKMNYINRLLKGKAAWVISGLSLSNENYSSALELLQEHSRPSQMLFKSYMDTISYDFISHLLRQEVKKLSWFIEARYLALRQIPMGVF